MTAPTDSYLYGMPIGEAEFPYYRAVLQRYPSAGVAALGRARLRQAAATALAVGGCIIERTVDDVALGDEGLAVRAGYGEGGVVVERRYIIFVRVGAEIVSVEANRLPATAQAPAAVMAALMAKQVACLEATGWCEPVPMPAELRSATAGD